MGVVPSTVGPSAVAEHQPADSGTTVQRLILCRYLLGALAVTCRLWVDPAGREPVGNPHDFEEFAWFLRYAGAWSSCSAGPVPGPAASSCGGSSAGPGG